MPAVYTKGDYHSLNCGPVAVSRNLGQRAARCLLLRTIPEYAQRFAGLNLGGLSPSTFLDHRMPTQLAHGALLDGPDAPGDNSESRPLVLLNPPANPLHSCPRPALALNAPLAGLSFHFRARLSALMVGETSRFPNLFSRFDARIDRDPAVTTRRQRTVASADFRHVVQQQAHDDPGVRIHRRNYTLSRRDARWSSPSPQAPAAQRGPPVRGRLGLDVVLSVIGPWMFSFFFAAATASLRSVLVYETGITRPSVFLGCHRVDRKNASVLCDGRRIRGHGEARCREADDRFFGSESATDWAGRCPGVGQATAETTSAARSLEPRRLDKCGSSPQSVELMVSDHVGPEIEKQHRENRSYPAGYASVSPWP